MGPLIVFILFGYILLIKEELFGLCNMNSNTSKDRCFFFVMCTVLSILVGFRDVNIGSDTVRYYNKFLDLSYDKYLDYGEVGSYLLMHIAYELNNPQIFFLVTAFIVVFLYMYAISVYSYKKNSISWGYMLFLSSTVGLSSIVSIERQVLACAVILFGTRFLIERKFVKWIVTIVVAASFHISSLFLVVLYPITSRKFKYKYIALATLILLLISDIFMRYIVEMFPHYETYITMYVDDGHGVKQLVMYICLFILFSFNYMKYKTDEKYNIFLKIYIVGMALLASLFPWVGISISVRFAYVCLCYMFVLISYCMDVRNMYVRCMFKIAMVLILTILYLYTMDISEMIPYELYLY